MCLRALLWSLLSEPYPRTKMLSAMPNTYGRYLNISSIFIGTYHVPVPLQMVVWWICTCQIDMQRWLGMRIFYWTSGCHILSMHQLWSYSIHFLVWEIYHLMLGLCLLTFLVSGWDLQGLDIFILCHWAEVLWWSCCTTRLFYPPNSVCFCCSCSLYNSVLNG